MRPSLRLGVLHLGLAAACGGDLGAGADAPSGSTDAPAHDALVVDAPRDTVTPFPIDGASLPGAPQSYRGLPLALTDNGAPTVTAVRGVIGVVCVGMSNAAQECGAYLNALAGPLAAEVAPAVRVVNCAVGGHALERWIDPAFDATLWDACVTQRLPAAGVALDQVRVIYHKAADQFAVAPDGQPLPPYPDPRADYFTFQTNLSAFAARVPVKFPAVQAVYTASRSYGGYNTQPGRGEPLSYEEGHALNQWLVANRQVGGVWFGWGPYLWAPDCAVGTNGAGTCYVRSDYQADGVHPDLGARAKITALIHQRFRREAWYRGGP